MYRDYPLYNCFRYREMSNLWTQPVTKSHQKPDKPLATGVFVHQTDFERTQNHPLFIVGRVAPYKKTP